MRLSAIQSAGDAIDVTRVYLAGRSWRQLPTLALMVLFLGPTGISGPPGPFELEDEAIAVDGELPSLSELLDAVDWELAVALIGLIGALAVVYGLVSAFMEFSFVHSLVADTAAIRAPSRDHWSRALSLFVFRAVVWGAAATAGAVLVAGALGLVELPVTPGWLGLWALVLLGGGLVYLLNRFTTDFVVPIMYHERRGLLGGWRRLLGLMRHEWRQFAVYVPVRVMLEVALGIAFSIVIAVVLFALAIVVGVPVGVVLVLVLGPVPGVLLTVGLIGLLAVVLLAGALIPFHTYLRYYTLLVLGDTSARLDLVARKRERVRA